MLRSYINPPNRWEDLQNVWTSTRSSDNDLIVKFFGVTKLSDEHAVVKLWTALLEKADQFKKCLRPPEEIVVATEEDATAIELPEGVQWLHGSRFLFLRPSDLKIRDLVMGRYKDRLGGAVLVYELHFYSPSPRRCK